MTRPVVRVGLAVLGAAGVGYGLRDLLALGWGNLVPTVVWLGGAVVVHDALIAPAVLVLAWWTSRHLRPRMRTVVARSFVVLGPLVLLSVPVLGRFGAKPDNPSLLDRPYAAGLGACVALVCVVAVVTAGRPGEGGRRGGRARRG